MGTTSLLTKDALDQVAGPGTPAFAVDLRERIIYWNAGTERLLGWTAAQMLGRPCFDVLAGRDVFGNPFCMKDCNLVRASIGGETLEPFFMELNQKKGGSCQVLVRPVLVPAAGPDCAGCLLKLVAFGDGPEFHRLVRLIRATAQPVSASPRSDPVPPGSPLTAREQEILALLAEGYAALNVAVRLNLSHATVRNHVQNILYKLEVHSQVEAISVAFRRGWL